jgi:hypothetical protein
MQTAKELGLIALYVAIGLIVAGLLQGVVSSILPASLGGGTAPTA